MIDKLKHKSELFRQSFFCLIIFFALFAFSGIFALTAAETGYSANAADNSHLAAFPAGDVDDEAAVRWNYRCRTNSALRLDNHNNSRTVSNIQSSSAELQSISCGQLSVYNKSLWHNQPLLTYYRRLWQKILPSRAGPCVCS